MLIIMKMGLIKEKSALISTIKHATVEDKNNNEGTNKLNDK